MHFARFARQVLLCSFFLTTLLHGGESLGSGRLVVVLQNALPWPTVAQPQSVQRALVFTFSDWTSGKPHLEAIAVRDAQSEAACSSAAFSQGRLEATIKFTVKDRGRDSRGSGEVSIRTGLEGTTGTGRYQGSYAGNSFAGDVRTALAFGHQFPDGQRSLRLWLPDLQQEVRGVMIYGNGAGGDDRDTILGDHMLAFAAANRLGLIGTSQFGPFMRRGEGQMLLDALKTFARTTAHPELEHAAIVFTGHSNGGQMAHEFNAWMPSRVVAFSVWRGGVYESYTGLSKEALATPGVLSAGETDLERRVEAIRRLFDLNRPLGANWSLLVEEKMGHNRGNSLTLFLLVFQHILEQRLPPEASSRQGPVQLRPMDPKRAWLADNSTWKDGITKIMPAREFTSDTSRMSWLPDKDVAFIYRGLASYSNPLQLTRIGHASAYRADEPVVLECTGFGGAAWKSVVAYDGSQQVGELTREKSQLVLKGPHTPGAHAAVVVGTLSNGEIRTSIPVDWVVWPATQCHQVTQ
jgi:hypothetical protein